MRMLICLVLFLSECVVKMDLFVKTKIRGVTKLVSCNSNESDVFDFIVRGKLRNLKVYVLAES